MFGNELDEAFAKVFLFEENLKVDRDMDKPVQEIFYTNEVHERVIRRVEDHQTDVQDVGRDIPSIWNRLQLIEVALDTCLSLQQGSDIRPDEVEELIGAVMPERVMAAHYAA